MSGNSDFSIDESKMKETLGAEQYKYYLQLKELQQMTKGTQARMVMLPEIR
jgi:hypothetical protein